MKQNKIEAWNGFWEHHDEDKLQSGADYWTNFVWQTGLNYWQEVFEKLSPLPLPKIMHKMYAGLMRKMLPVWRKFDRSNSWFSEVW